MARQNASVDNLREDQINFRNIKKKPVLQVGNLANQPPVLNQVQFPQETFKQPDRESMTANFISNLLPKAGEVVGGVVSRGQELAGTGLEKLTELAKDPRTYETLANIGQIAYAYEDPYTAQALGRVASSLGEERIAKQEAKTEEAKLASQLLKEDNEALGTYSRANFRESREGDNPNFIQKVRLPSGREVSMFNQNAATEAGELALKGQPKAPKGYIPLDPNLEESLADIKEDTVFKQSGAVSGNFVDPEKVAKIVEQKAIDTEELLSTQANTKLINEDISRIIFDPNLDDLVGKQSILGFNVSKRFLAGLTGLPEEIENLISSTDVISSGKILNTLISLKKKGGGSTGFGALNQSELKVISDSIASLNTSQSKEQFIRSLQKIDKVFSDSTKRLQKEYGKKYVTEGIEMYESPYDVKANRKSIDNIIDNQNTQPNITDIIYGNVPAQADSNVMQVGRFVMEVD